MMGGSRFCSVQSFCTIILLELWLMLGLWVGDNLQPELNRTPAICDVTNSSIVRKLIQKNWSPILKRYGVSLPVECPFNLSRDLHDPRQSVKGTRYSHWQCLKCGKKFYFERHLDIHIERRHSSLINNVEDSVCLGDFCDIMRCEVLKSTSFLDDEPKSTDVSIWTPSHNSGSNKGQSSHPPGSSSSTTHKRTIGHGHGHHHHHSHPHSHSTHPQENQQINNVDTNHKSDSADSVEHCDEAYYTNLRIKCADLVWNCLQGLISVLDAKDFKALQNELESVSCSYLSCSRYGDKCCPPSSKGKGKLRPFFIVFGSLFISLCLALAYYFTWIYTQSGSSEDVSFSSEEDANTKCMDQEVSSSRKKTAPLLNRTTHL